jgi:FkbM family methyltransferase
MKRQLLDLANDLIAPLGVQLYRKGIDMRSVMRRIAGRQRGIAGIVDIGAAKGHWSRMALAIFPQAQVIGIDPLVERESFLQGLKAREARYDYVLAVAGETDGGTVSLAVTSDLDGSKVDGDEGARRDVSVRSIDSIVAEKGLLGPYFLKFDTHGFEDPILRGATKTLAATNYIVMEAYNFRHTPQTRLFHEMIDLLGSLGFRVFNLVDPLQRDSDGALWQIDLFFARSDDPIFASNSFRHG